MLIFYHRLTGGFTKLFSYNLLSNWIALSAERITVIFHLLFHPLGFPFDLQVVVTEENPNRVNILFADLIKVIRKPGSSLPIVSVLWKVNRTLLRFS